MIDFVKVIESTLDTLGVKVKFTRMGRDDVRETEQITAPGFESRPVKDMIAVYARTGHDGDDMVIGYLVKNAITDVGESRMFSTDEDGNEVFSIHLKNDGTAEIGGDADNMVRYSKLEEAFNQLKQDFDNHVSNYNSHIHITTATVGPSAVPGTISPTVSSSTPSTADITPAKIDEIKTS